MISENENVHWVEKEFASLCLGDKRLNERARKLAKSFAQAPHSSIPSACDTWKDTHAAYSFFSNAKVKAEKILAPHIESTLERASQCKVVLAVQDTTSLNFTGLKQTKDLGEIGDSIHRKGRGLICHNTYLINDEGIPLGCLGQDIWDRKTSQCKASSNRTKTAITHKESFKWLSAMRKTSELTTSLEQSCVIHVADREADIYELFEEAKTLDENFIIRVKSNRRINKSSRGSSDGEKLFARLSQTTPIGRLETLVNERSTPGSTRQAELVVRAINFELTAPRAKSMHDHKFVHPRLSLTVISVQEETDDDSIEPINWMLVTNTQINTLEEAIYCVKCYCHRWNVEVFHRILKTGCRVEAVRFDTAEKIKTYTAFLAVIAWRIHWLTLHTRLIPTESADLLFGRDDQLLLESLVLREQKKKPGRKKKLTVQECVTLLARLGGFLARKGDGHPGAEVIWRGMNRLYEIKLGINRLQHAGLLTYL